MPYTPTTGDRLLAAWLSLTSTLWNFPKGGSVRGEWSFL